MSDKIDVPQGHYCPEDASPLVRLTMQNLGKVYVEWPPGKGRRMLADVLLEMGGADTGCLYALAVHAVESMPAEVWIARGGCGGECAAAFWTEAGYREAHSRTLDMFDVEYSNDPLWPVVERIPLVKR